MPFTVGGDWIPPDDSKPKLPVKVFTEKRRGKSVTLVRNLPLSTEEMKKLCSKIKSQLGCGGSVKNEMIEIQGDHVDAIRSLLKETFSS